MCHVQTFAARCFRFVPELDAAIDLRVFSRTRDQPPRASRAVFVFVLLDRFRFISLLLFYFSFKKAFLLLLIFVGFVLDYFLQMSLCTDDALFVMQR